MPRICYQLQNRAIDTDPATTILQTSLRAGIPHTHVCGGNARCSTCRVLILEGLEHCAPRNVKERAMAERLGFSAAIRLACQTTLTGNVTLRHLVLDEEDVEITNQESPETAAGQVGQEKQVAILFADIRGFTTFSETLPPYDIIHVLNRYFNRVDKVIRQHGGSINTYMGDGLMALFGVDDPTGAPLRAVKAGLEMLGAVDRLKPYLQAQYRTDFRIGIGVHYGEVIVGTVGAAGRGHLTAIGDAVNLASRIEAANKPAGTGFLISQDAYAQVAADIQVGKRLPTLLPGKRGEYTLYEVTGLRERGH